MTEPTAVYLAETQTKEAISLDKIRTDGGTQARAGLNDGQVAEYQLILEDAKATALPAWPFKDAIDLFYDGSDYWLADGFHRVEACRRAVWLWRIRANIHQGTRRDAILFAAGANATHGLPRSVDDKRRAVETLLRDEEWGKWSDREIARRCHVSPTFVGKIRNEVVTVHVDSERTYTTRHGTEATMKTAEIGRKRRVAQYEFTTAVRGWIEHYCGNRENWLPATLAMWKSVWKGPKDARLAEIESKYLYQYEYTPAMLHSALGTIIDDEKLFWERVTNDKVYRWLSTYTDDKGRTWKDLEDNQVHHANSPCYQAFVKEFPNLTDPKLYLKRALARLKQEVLEAAVTADRVRQSRSLEEAAKETAVLPKTYHVTQEQLEKYAQTNSAGKIDKGHILTPFEHDGHLLICTGSSSRGSKTLQCNAMRVIPIEDFPGRAITYQEASRLNPRGPGFYHGIKVTYQKTMYVIISPAISFLPIPEAADQLEETAVAPTPPIKPLDAADLEQSIMHWGIGQRPNNIPGQLELMKAILEQQLEHELWSDMMLKLSAPARIGDLHVAIKELIKYLQERADEQEAEIISHLSAYPIHVDQLKELVDLSMPVLVNILTTLEMSGRVRQAASGMYVAATPPKPETAVADDTYSYADELQQYIQAAETAVATPPQSHVSQQAADYMTINTLELLAHTWLREFYGDNLQSRLKAAHMMKTDVQCVFWNILETHKLKPTRRPYRAGDLRQAVNNVTEQLRQQLHQTDQSAAALFLTEEAAVWQLRHLLDEMDIKLVRSKMLYPDVEQIALSVAALRSAINLVRREARRTLRHNSEEEE